MEDAQRMWVEFDDEARHDNYSNPRYVGLLSLPNLLNYVDENMDGDPIDNLEDMLSHRLWPDEPAALAELERVRRGEFTMQDDEVVGLLCSAIHFGHCDILEAMLPVLPRFAEELSRALYEKYNPRLCRLYPQLIEAIPPSDAHDLGRVAACPQLLNAALFFLGSRARELGECLQHVSTVEAFLALEGLGVYIDIEQFFQKVVSRFIATNRFIVSRHASIIMLARFLARRLHGGANAARIEADMRARGLFWTLYASDEERAALRQRCDEAGVPAGVYQALIEEGRDLAVRHPREELVLAELQDVFCFLRIYRVPFYERQPIAELLQRMRAQLGFA